MFLLLAEVSGWTETRVGILPTHLHATVSPKALTTVISHPRQSTNQSLAEERKHKRSEASWRVTVDLSAAGTFTHTQAHPRTK